MGGLRGRGQRSDEERRLAAATEAGGEVPQLH